MKRRVIVVDFVVPVVVVAGVDVGVALVVVGCDIVEIYERIPRPSIDGRESSAT